jgi:CubicO group peptidase (beta-lactamase class C family)
LNSLYQDEQKSNSEISVFESNLQTFFDSVRKETGVPGICLGLNIAGQNLLISNGKLAVDSVIQMNPNARFQLGCITKLLTAMVTAEMITSGKIDPDDPIEKYLEELKGTERGKNIAVWHLLSHTSGYRGLNLADPSVAYYYSWPKFLNFFQATSQLFKPGTVFSYEHSEYAILGEILERISGERISDLYDQMIFKPLNLTAGSIKNDYHEKKISVADHTLSPTELKYNKIKAIPYGSFWRASLSEITMSVQDLLKIASVLCEINSVSNGISDKAIAFVQKQVIKLPQTHGSARHEQLPGAFGVGCAAYRGWLLGHNGSARGQTCGLRFDPRNKIALVIGMNAWQPFLRDSIINHIFGSLRGEPIPSSPEEPFNLPLSDLVGTYIGSQDQEITVKKEGDQIACTLNPSKEATLTISMKKDETGNLRVCSETMHYSLGFFCELDSGTLGIMLGLTAFRKQ